MEEITLLQEEVKTMIDKADEKNNKDDVCYAGSR